MLKFILVFVNQNIFLQPFNNGMQSIFNSTFFNDTPTKIQRKGSSLAAYKPTRIKELQGVFYVNIRNILAMDEYKGQSYEGLRLEDYEIGRKSDKITVYPPYLCNTAPLKQDVFQKSNSFFPEIKTNPFQSQPTSMPSNTLMNWSEIQSKPNLAPTSQQPYISTMNQQQSTNPFLNNAASSGLSSFLNQKQNPFATQSTLTTSQNNAPNFNSMGNQQFNMTNPLGSMNLTNLPNLQTNATNFNIPSNMNQETYKPFENPFMSTSTTTLKQNPYETSNFNNSNTNTQNNDFKGIYNNNFSNPFMKINEPQTANTMNTSMSTFNNTQNPYYSNFQHSQFAPGINTTQTIGSIGNMNNIPIGNNDFKDPFMSKDMKEENIPIRKVSHAINKPENIFKETKPRVEEQLKLNIVEDRDKAESNKEKLYNFNTIPGKRELRKMKKVKNLILELNDSVSIHYLTEIDTSCIENIAITFKFPEIIIFDPPGTGLNKQARVKIENAWPLSRTKGFLRKIDDIVDKGIVERYVYELSKILGKRFIEYNLEKGEIIYEVKNFKSIQN